MSGHSLLQGKPNRLDGNCVTGFTQNGFASCILPDGLIVPIDHRQESHRDSPSGRLRNALGTCILHLHDTHFDDRMISYIYRSG